MNFHLREFEKHWEWSITCETGWAKGILKFSFQTGFCELDIIRVRATRAPARQRMTYGSLVMILLWCLWWPWWWLDIKGLRQKSNTVHKRRRRSETKSMFGKDLASMILRSRSPWRYTVLLFGATSAIPWNKTCAGCGGEQWFSGVSAAADGGGGRWQTEQWYYYGKITTS